MPTSIHPFAGGRISVVQPTDHHYSSGLEAGLIAAALEDGFSGTVVDLGCGPGEAGLTVAARCEGAKVVLVDRDRDALACAAAALELADNAIFADRVRVIEADVTWSEARRVAAGLERMSADAVIVNPPFQSSDQASPSPYPERSAAHVLGPGGLEPWLRCAASILRHDGQLVLVVAADMLPALLHGPGHRFGEIDLLPVHPRAGEPAARLLARAIKDSRAGLRFLPGLNLHGATGSAYLHEIDDVLRGRAALSDVHPVWKRNRS